MSADIIYKDRMIHLSESSIRIVSIEIIRHLQQQPEVTCQAEMEWRNNVRQTCESNIRGRGFGMADLDLATNASTEEERIRMIDLLQSICKSYDSTPVLKASTINQYSPSQAYADDFETDKIKPQIEKVIDLLASA